MRWVVISIVMTASTLTIGQTATPASARDERAIIQLRDALLKAYDAGDVKTLSEIEDYNFTMAGDFGQVTKQQHLDQVRRREKPQIVSRKIDNQFRFYGDVALLTEVDHATDAEGKADFQTTILWVRHGDTWRAAHMHYSKMNDAP
ncbi:MAG: nuclear transport factor 2 family protein [Acidobacteriia bacterium]|nr:nuclear transport factor 2 family protein [Terriglobia bacterium]